MHASTIYRTDCACLSYPEFAFINVIYNTGYCPDIIYALSSLHSLVVMDATERQQLDTHSYVIIMANSILMYDHMMTLAEEVNFIWRRPKALSAISFLVNRYFALLGNIYGLLVAFMPIPNQRFELLTLEYSFFRSKNRLAVRNTWYSDSYSFFSNNSSFAVIILIIRTYALYNCNKRLFAWITIIFVGLAGGASEPLDIEAYVIILAILRVCSKVVAELPVSFGIAWLAILAFELLIFALTVHRTCKTRGLLRLSLVTRRNILDVIFHDGAMYFGAMTLCNIPNIVMYFYGSGVVRGSLGLATFTSCMSVTLISRLILNLHKSIDSGIFSVPVVRDDDHCLSVLTTRINVQSAIA
ncbi:hypothetical protein EDD22DRAFT_1014233 [Suillus occidentalis]|nr:hypothetical protein EDD22DRAFT_1014233 [Suillus occidentalis]